MVPARRALTGPMPSVSEFWVQGVGFTSGFVGLGFRDYSLGRLSGLGLRVLGFRAQNTGNSLPGSKP